MNPKAPHEIANLRRLLARAGAHRAFDCHAAAREFREAFAAWGATPFQFLFERVDALPRDAAEVTLHDIWLQLAEDGPGLAYRLVYDRDVMPEATASAVARAFEAALAEGAGMQARGAAPAPVAG